MALVVKDLPTDAADARLNPWVGKMPWNRKWQPALVFLPGRFHGQRSLGAAAVRGVKESDTKRTLTDCQAWIYIFNIYEY